MWVQCRARYNAKIGNIGEILRMEWIEHGHGLIFTKQHAFFFELNNVRLFVNLHVYMMHCCI